MNANDGVAGPPDVGTRPNRTTTRREFGRTIAAGVVASMASPAHALQMTTKGTAVAGVRIVDSKVARSAVELARNAYPPYLFNHAMRTFLFGALIGRSKKHTWDLEVFFLACVLHDLGLTARFAGDMPFELQGADAAMGFLKQAGFGGRRSMTVWDAIAMHPYAIADHKPPEIALVAAGAAADVVGADLALVAPRDRDEVLGAYPRLQFKRAFVDTCADVVRTHPGGASRSFMRDIGERYVTDFHPRNICDAITQSPFSE